MSKEFILLRKQIRRTRWCGAFAIASLGLITAGTFYHLKVVHHRFFNDIHKKYKAIKDKE